jgi:hypothetical protein
MPHNSNHDDFKAATNRVSYKDRLNNWAIARLLPNMQHTIVGRFRSRSDAEGHLQCLRQLMPDVSFVVVFDCQAEVE